MASFWCGILTLCIQTPEGELKPEVNDICCSVVPLCAPVGARPERLMMRPHATRTTTTQDPGIPVPTKIAISITPRGAAKLEQLHKAWDRRPDGLTIVSAHARVSELMELLGMALIEMASLLGGGASMFNDNVQTSKVGRYSAIPMRCHAVRWAAGARF